MKRMCMKCKKRVQVNYLSEGKKGIICTLCKNNEKKSRKI